MKKNLFIILSILCVKIFAQPNVPSYVSTTCLLGWWPFTNNAADSSGNARNGTVTGAVLTSGITGAANTAYKFNGTSDFIKVLNATALTGFPDITISAWVKPKALTATASGIVTKWYRTGGCVASTNRDTYAMTVNSGNIPCGTSQAGAALAPLGLVIGDTGRFNHIVYISQSGGTQKVYVNGILVGTATQGSGNLCSTINDLYFGADNNGGMIDRYFKGSLDEIGIWCRALDSCEVRHLYNLGNASCSPVGPPLPPSSGCCLGNYCGTSPNALTGSYQVPMNANNFNFTMPQNSKSQVLIGKTSCASTFARLDVSDDNLSYGIRGYSSTQSKNNIGIHGLGFIPNGNITGLTTIGVLGESNKVERSNGAAIAAFCAGPAVLSAIPVGKDIAIYGNSIANGGAYAGYFDGDVLITGNGWVNGVIPISSDRRFKTNIKELTSVTEKLKTLKGYTYDFKTDEFKDRNFPKTQQIGFIAQELKEVFPQLVLENKDGYYGVNYMGFIPVLLQAAKEQQTLIDSQSESIQQQQKQIDELKTLVQSMAGVNTTTGKTTGVAINLSDRNAVVLNQNVPNPFAESSVITYNVPSDFSKAQIIFTTNEGKIIKTVDITVKGAGSLNVFANDLSHGMYSYSLVVDGKTIDTKKMIKE